MFREKTQRALQQLEDMETQLKTLLGQLENDRGELEFESAVNEDDVDRTGNSADGAPMSDN